MALIRKATGEARRSEGNALLTVQALTANLSLLLWKSRFLPTNGQTIDRVEASIKRLADFDRTVEKSARELALERLDRLPIVPAY